MKKRILAIMLVLPLLVAFAAMGFTSLVSLAIPQLPEDIRLEYDMIDAFEFANFGDTVELKGFVVPMTSSAQLVWTSSNEEIAKIDGNKLTFVDEGTVEITATVIDTNLSKTFTATCLLIGDVPKAIKANYVFPAEKGNNVIGLYDYVDSYSGEEKTAHTEIVNFSVLPSMSPQNVTVSGMPEGEYKLEGSKLLLTPSKVGKYDIAIQSAEQPDVVFNMSFEVTDSVNVYSYEDLVRATDKSTGYPLSLRVNLESKSNLQRANSKAMAYASGPHEYVTFESTYDTKYLKNIGANTRLKAAIVFKADVYGNGHTLNLHDFAYPSEVDPSTNIAIPSDKDVFASEPLEFVNALGLVVFGQGNVGFMIEGDNITVDNIVLKNCNNVADLSNLDYVGTVVEVVGDNVVLKNSTVMNGRTVVRSFSNDNLLIEGCTLAYAREFIFKQGSNNFVYPDREENGEMKSWVEAQKDLFDNSRLPEEALVGDSTATIKDTAFYTSGIFCIGMDTHFAGEFLYSFDETISDLAATSYKSTLNLEGNIRFYDWKVAKNMDSSTLVKGSFEGLDLNIYQLLKNYEKVYNNNQIFKTVKGVQYVHGGIAFFGGGNNLSEIYFNGTRVKCDPSGNYGGLNDDTYFSLSVSLSDSSIFDMSAILKRAAGEGAFSFCIFRNTYDEIGVDDSPF